MIFRKFLFFIILILLVSCREQNTGVSSSSGPGKQDMEDLNRYLVQKDRDRIISYIERKGLNMNETPSGLWYQILEEGSGERLQAGSHVVMEYECSLLDGTLCYTSDETGPKQLVLGRTGIEPGMYEGLLMLRPGSHAIFIIPPFLAYGLPGDGKKIPPRSVVVYNVTISEIE